MFWIINIILFGLVYYVGYQCYLNNYLPPGPWGIPVFGYLPWLNPAEPYKTLTTLSRKYGPIYSIQMGKHFAVVMSDPASVRMALARNELADRTNFEMVNEIMQGHGTHFPAILIKIIFVWLKNVKSRFNIYTRCSLERTTQICLQLVKSTRGFQVRRQEK